MSLPHISALGVPSGVGKCLALQGNGANKCTWIGGAVPRRFVVATSGGFKRDARTSIFDHRARGAWIITQQCYLCTPPKYARVGVQRCGGETKRPQFFAGIRSHHRQVSCADLRYDPCVPMCTTLAAGCARGGGTINAHACINEPRVDGAAGAIVNGCSSGNIKRSIRTSAFDPSILHQHHRVGQTFTRHCSDGHMDQCITTNISRAHPNWWWFLRQCDSGK